MATTIQWPLDLPQNFQQSGYSEGNIDNVLSTTMTTGPSKSRPKSTEAYQPISGTMILTTAQRASFKTFYKDTIYFGAVSFSFPAPGDAPNFFKAKLKTQGISPRSGNSWNLQMSIEILVT